MGGRKQLYIKAFEGNGAINDDTLTDEAELRPRQIYTRARVQDNQCVPHNNQHQFKTCNPHGERKRAFVAKTARLVAATALLLGGVHKWLCDDDPRLTEALQFLAYSTHVVGGAGHACRAARAVLQRCYAAAVVRTRGGAAASARARCR